MKNYTIIPNELLDESPLPIQTRYLLCVLKRFAGQDEYCYPSQHRLSRAMGLSERQIRSHLRLLEKHGYISTKRRGFNRPNTYQLNSRWGNPTSGHLGNRLLPNPGNQIPTKSTYRKPKNKRGMELLRDVLEKRDILHPKPLIQK